MGRNTLILTEPEIDTLLADILREELLGLTVTQHEENDILCVQFRWRKGGSTFCLNRRIHETDGIDRRRFISRLAMKSAPLMRGDSL